MIHNILYTFYKLVFIIVALVGAFYAGVLNERMNNLVDSLNRFADTITDMAKPK